MAVGVIASVVALSACSTDNTHLPALLDDPMASYEAEGIVLLDAWQQKEGQSIVTGKPVYAEVGRTYRIANQNLAGQILDEAVITAESNGWRITPPPTTGALGYGGTKELPPGNGRLGIALVAADPLNDPDGPRVLSIVVDFGSVRFDDTTTSAPGES